MFHRAPAASMSTLSRAIGALGTALAMAAAVLPSPVLAQANKTAVATALPASAVQEIRQRLAALGMQAVNVDAFLARLTQLNLTDLRALAADVTGTRLQQLLGSDIAPGGGLPSGNRLQDGLGASAGGSGLQAAINSTLKPGIGNMTGGGSGQAAESGETCHACPASGTAGSGSDTNTYEPTKIVETKDGTVIKTYDDGSASITPKNADTEYINSAHRVVDRHGNAKTPSPDAETRSGVLTAKDIATALSRVNANRTTNPDAATGTGGSVDGNRSNPVGSRGLFTDVTTRTLVSISAVREVIRVAIERVRGPVTGG